MIYDQSCSFHTQHSAAVEIAAFVHDVGAVDRPIGVEVVLRKEFPHLAASLQGLLCRGKDITDHCRRALANLCAACDAPHHQVACKRVEFNPRLSVFCDG